ncbi:MAG: Cna B-type domain-containing protein, partial [Clostridiales bacterium]|nr:Cna B-type domain-containing protein [Clostridiales bacterium]
MSTKRVRTGRKGIAFMLTLAMICSLVTSLAPVSFAADYDEGDIPINDYYSIDKQIEGVGDPPDPGPAPGQIWTGKSVVPDSSHNGVFTITLKAWGNTYTDGGVTKNPLVATNSAITITDTLGEWFELAGAVPAGVAVSGKEVTWVVDQSETLGAAPAAVSFNVTLKEGWEADQWYYTNDGVSARFQPQEGNPYYWTLKNVEQVHYEIDGVKWNSGQGGRIQEVHLIDHDLIIDGKEFEFSLSGNYGDNAPFTVIGYNGRVNVASTGLPPGYVYRFTFTVFDLPEAGSNTVYEAMVDNEGGNVNANTIYSKTTTYTTWHHRNEFTWAGDTVVEDIPGTGKIRMHLESVDVEGTKKWVDNGNADNTRPESITIQLLRRLVGDTEWIRLDTTTIPPAGENVGGTDEWGFKFSKLPLYNSSGIKFEYRVEEVALADYLSTVDNETNTITNTLKPGITSVTVSKAWEDNNNSKGRRPASVTFNLLADGAKVREYVMSSPWNEYTFIGLPKYDSDQKLIEYTVTEDSVDGYTTAGGAITGGSATFTNTLVQTGGGTMHLSKSVDGTFIADWEYDGASIADVWEDISFKLFKAIVDADGNCVGYDDSTVVASAALTDSGEFAFEILPGSDVDGWYAIVEFFTPGSLAEEIFDNVGPQYVFFVDGVGVGGTKVNFDYNARYTIRNGYGQGYVLGYKGLNDDGDIFPIGVENAETGERYPSYCANGGSYAFFEGPGKYVVEKKERPNGVPLVNFLKAYNYIEAKYGNLDDNRAVTQIITWVLLEAIDVSSPAFNSIDWAVVATGTGAVKGAPNAKAIVEDVAANYSSFVFNSSAGIIDVVYMVGIDDANYYEAQPQLVPVYGSHGFNNRIKVSIEGSKIWEDDGNADNTRPESITVNLLRNGVQYDTLELKLEDFEGIDEWAFEFKGLPKYDSSGIPYAYTVDEVLPTGYEKSIDGTKITNTLTPGETSVTVSKAWSDGGNSELTRPESITFRLYANGVELEDEAYEMAAPWADYTFTGLPKYDG